jgi:iron(III) transport system permease protein
LISNYFKGVVLLAIFLFILPFFYIVKISFVYTNDIWPHLYQTLLPLYLKNTFLLTGGTALLATILGVFSAWTVTFYDFPTRKILIWALLLPFAFPTYIMAYIYTDIFDYPGPIQSILRNVMNWSSKKDYWFPEIRSLEGAIILFSLALYPYIYLFTRKALLEQSLSIRQMAEVLGIRKIKILFKISWPLTRPAILVGVFLVIMETITDFGTVDYFSLNTLSLGIYNVWINMGSLESAVQISLITLVIVLIIIFLERIQRFKKTHIETQGQKITYKIINRKYKWIFFLFNWLLILLGFGIPFIVLIKYSLQYFINNNYYQISIEEFFILSKNSLLIAISISFLTSFIALILVKIIIKSKSLWLKSIFPIFSIGYALPGTVLGVGVLLIIVNLNPFFEGYLFISGTLLAVVYAYVIRFITIPIGAIETGYKKISPNIYYSATLLIPKWWKILLIIDFPLMKKSIFTASIIVFVDVMKELPLMLMLRPINFETLATNVYNFASDENIEQACLSALTIVLIGILPIIFLSKSIDQKQKS